MAAGDLINSDTVTGILALVCVWLTFAVPIARMVRHLVAPAPKLPTEEGRYRSYREDKGESFFHEGEAV